MYEPRHRGTEVVVDRPRLDALLPVISTTRCTTIVAGPGFGKTTLIEQWSATTPMAVLVCAPSDRALPAFARRVAEAIRLRVPAWRGRAPDASAGPDVGRVDAQRAESFAAGLIGSLGRHLTRPLVVVFDDVDTLAGSEGALFLDAFVRHAPRSLPVVLAGRAEPPIRLARLRAAGDVFDLGPEDLAFTAEEVDHLAARLGVPQGTARDIHALTAGWPVATRLALETIAAGGASDLGSGATPLLLSYLAEELFADQSPEDRELLGTLAHLGPVDPRVVEAVGFPDAPERLAEFVGRGLMVEQRGSKVGVVPVVARYLLDEAPQPVERVITVHAAASRWYAERREPFEALAHAAAAGDLPLVRRVAADFGRALIAGGRAADLIDVIGDMAASDPALERLLGDALQAVGDWDGALATYSRAVPEEGPIDPGVAWRIGLIHYLRGELELAVGVFERGGEGSLADRAMLLGWWAAAAWVGGDAETCRWLAGAALEAALESRSDAALAAAYTAQAMVAALEGDRRANETLYQRALDHAVAAGDVLQQVRIHVNRGSRLLEEGAFEAAIDECGVALDLADLGGYVSLRALATANRGQAHLGLGRIDEALADFEIARVIWGRLGSRQVAYALESMGHVNRLRGNLVGARAAYEEARAVLEPVGDQQGLVPTIAGLARVLVDEDPDAALELASAAVGAGTVLGHVDALLALAEVHLARGESTEAAGAAERALTIARSRRDRAGMAEAIELRCVAGGAEPAALAESVRTWADLGNPLGRARARLRMVQLGAAGRDVLGAVSDTFRALGARRLLAEANALAGGPDPGPVWIQTLGGFRVVVDGDPVGPEVWQSKKARDLLKVLLARRGRAVHREELIEILWPDDDPSKTTNRLSVALSVVRSVLGDRGADTPGCLEADRTSVRLAVDRVGIDLEAFHADVAAGYAAARDGDDDVARAHYRRAESRYVGDFLEEDPYEDWAVAEREQARQAYLDGARWLAADATARGDLGEATRLRFRVLRLDPYDEPAHLDLVAAMVADRRHGEARRLYGRYCAAMSGIGVEAAPFPG